MAFQKYMMTLKCLVTISQHPSREQEDRMVYVFHLRTDPGGLVLSNLPANEGDVGLIPGSGRSLKKEMEAHSNILAGKYGQRSLVGYSPWGHKRVSHDLVTKPPPPQLPRVGTETFILCISSLM